MRPFTLRRLVRLVPMLLAVLTAACIASPAQAAPRCAAADREPAELGARSIRAATLCLLNAERRAHGLRPLRHAAKLARAARKHSRDMVAHRYFAHDSRSGAAFGARIARTGWTRGRAGLVVGENLAWGIGAGATPRAIVAGWMASPPHRANVLEPRFRVIGIGVVKAPPTAPGRTGATYTTDFGS